MNPDLVNAALRSIPNPNVLINVVARRVRQLSSGDGRGSRPLVAGTARLGAADIALREIVEEKIGCEMPELLPLVRPTSRGRNRPKHWAKT